MPKKIVEPKSKAAKKSIQNFRLRYGIPAALFERLNVAHHSQDEASEMLGCPAPASGWKIPYSGMDGKPTGFFRIRFDHYVDSWASVTGTKPIRYRQPKDTNAEAYFSPLVDWEKLVKGTERLLITEGEMKSACATAHGFPCIGLGGAWSFGCKSRGLDLLPGLEQFNWKGRLVYIVFDSDAVSNFNVGQAENRLALLLLNRGARPHVVRLPAAPDGGKVGLDDYIIAS